MRETSPNKIYKNIECLCTIRGVSAAELCRNIDVSSGYFAPSQKSDRKYPALETLLKIAEYFSEPVEKIIYEDYSTALLQKRIAEIDSTVKRLTEEKKKLAAEVLAKAKARAAREAEIAKEKERSENGTL